MTPSDRRRATDEAFAEAAERPPRERAAFLEASGLDADARAEVEAMLAADAEASVFFSAAADRLAQAAEAVTTTAPERAGSWKPLRLIGRGGMGEVYLAERIGADAPDGFEQRAAIKLVQPGLAPSLVARFNAERRILAGLEHPGIARLLDGGTASDGRPFLAMEFVDGEPITQYCDRHRLSVDERLQLFSHVCDAVAYAHSRLVVHRDLKPSNVLVASSEAEGKRQEEDVPLATTPPSPRSPAVKLLDFGVARLLDPDAQATVTVTRAMTPEYAAPEQITGDPPTTATDVYALGVLLYELLAGQRPFRLPARLAAEAGRVVLEETPTDPSTAVGQTETAQTVAAARATQPDKLRRRLRGDLDQIAQVALRKEPERRYPSARAFGHDIQRHLRGEPVEARPATVSYRLGRFVRRNRAAVVAGFFGLGLLVAYATTVTVQRAEIARERDRAERSLGLLETVFREADPYRDEAEYDTLITAQTPLGQALYAAALRVERETNDPDIRHRLLGALAGSAAAIGDSLGLAVYDRRARLAEAAFGPDDPRTAEAIGSLGHRLSESARDSLDLARADSLLHRAAALADAAHGPNARETGRALVALATHLKDNGANGRGERLARRGVEIARQHLPESRADLETALMIWGLLLSTLGDAEGAYAAASESVETARAVRGEGSANLASVLANASQAAEAAGRMDDALAYEREAVALAQDRLGSNHENTLSIQSNFSTTLWNMGRFDEAESVQRDVLARRLATYGPVAAETGISYQQLAGVVGEDWQDPARVEEAAGLYRAAATAFDQAYPTTVPTRAFPHLSLANLEADRERWTEAESAAREAARLARQSVGESHPMWGDATVRVGRALIGQGRVDEGRRLLDAGLAVLRPAMGDDHERVREATRWHTDPMWRAYRQE